MTQLSGPGLAPRISGQFCPMLAIDIAESTRADRDEEIQRYLRDSAFGILRRAVSDSGMPWDQCQYEDRGDGVAVIFSPDVAAQPIVHPFPERLRLLIRLHNRCSCQPAQMQLRVAAHIGPVYCDEQGFSGDDVTLLCRMLDAKPLRKALSGSDCEFALMVSECIYDTLVRRRQSLVGPQSFCRVTAQVKHTPVRGWMYLPDSSAP